ncbi:hypothetical protein K461DRAFT_282556 [Myriangium duriaei CBS 260.36]|uniref:Uncharacterized protein n=1 Tax=Myriangium duriaei CBS 260.36 TaxID=1168546 RepID=A0A9P4IYC9_9PEZI|nr:hypothetical protein K461DRAFT_282556 [Myriangium duriaei CBS 260.36]
MLFQHYKHSIVFVALFLLCSIAVLNIGWHDGRPTLSLGDWTGRHHGPPSNGFEAPPPPAPESEAPKHDLAPPTTASDGQEKDEAKNHNSLGETIGSALGNSDSSESSAHEAPAKQEQEQELDNNKSGDTAKPQVGNGQGKGQWGKSGSALTGVKHRELFSYINADRKFTPIDFGNQRGYNPNIIPHPTDDSLWIVVAQALLPAEYAHTPGEGGMLPAGEEIVCAAAFINRTLQCTDEATVLPVAESLLGVCEGNLEIFHRAPGPRDARVFNGPSAPYIVYGSQSKEICLGIWSQDLRTLAPYFEPASAASAMFSTATEIQRPPPLGTIQKNYFFFWDLENNTYVHNDIFPSRTFAKLADDGSVGEDLAPAAVSTDKTCMEQYFPVLAPEDESVHQATNSLSITLCNRTDPHCHVNENNTFVMTIFNHKKAHAWHSEYEPFVMLFQQTAPFAVHSISQKPLWIHGRQMLTKESHSLLFEEYHPDWTIPAHHTEMFYVTSMSWKKHGQKYHGYLDDEMFLGFGIEDSRAGAIDILGKDLVQDLGICDF